ncbi:SPOR domain-containing protein [Altererythrobacter aquiaggeris]|uniref:SPOR domain-containing protein n=1 Tax=Aestuarierythrobacter aquiaggeris TaxID=1898396 RepID=UPI003019F558
MADVKAGVQAWSAGNYPAAVAEWQGPAAQGDADAQFNMAQAYRLGRGVSPDPAKAEEYYAKAAAQGHIKAADSYGLLLFQDGRRGQALPYVQAAALRGDPRAQYLVGVAHFNGDLVEKDWVRAYALLSAANATGLAQAVPALKQMDEYIPLDQRQQGVALAAVLRTQADATRARQLAAADLGSSPPGAAPVAVTASTAPAVTAPLPNSAARVPTPIVAANVAPSETVSSSIAEARAAVAEAARVTGTHSPATAGADFARPQAAGATHPDQFPAITPSARVVAKPAEGPWRVQLGAFGVKSNATTLWERLSLHPELAGKTRLLVPAGRVTKLLAGGFASRAEAAGACSALKRSGQECIVTR